MSWADLEETPPAQLFLKIEGFNRRERDHAELVRMQTYLLLSPYMDSKKPITLTGMWQFPWDKAAKPVDKERRKKDEKRARAIWDLIDSQKAAADQNKK